MFKKIKQWCIEESTKEGAKYIVSAIAGYFAKYFGEKTNWSFMNPFLWYIVALVIFFISLFALKKLLHNKLENKNNEQSESIYKHKYTETWFEFSCNDKVCSYIRDSNVHEMKKLGSYMVYYQDPTKEIQVEFIVGFKEPIYIDMYRVDILKMTGKTEYPYTVFCYPTTDIQDMSKGAIIRIGNIGLDDATYRISFLKK
jgi:hypothetical protein